MVIPGFQVTADRPGGARDPPNRDHWQAQHGSALRYPSSSSVLRVLPVASYARAMRCPVLTSAMLLPGHAQPSEPRVTSRAA
eukprot:2512677-Rhodomonas_salina.1